MNPASANVLHSCLAAVVLGVATLTTGCASQAPQPTSMRDPQANFSTYKTFAFDAKGRTDPAGAQQPLSILDQNIRAAITSEMTARAYSEAPAGTTADLLVAYETAKAETIKNNPFRVGIGVGSWGGNVGGGVSTSTPGAKQVTEGTLVIHAIDQAREAAVWEGRVTRELSKAGADPAVVQGAVAEVFKDFPPRNQR
jgi:hypothetical protein